MCFHSSYQTKRRILHTCGTSTSKYREQTSMKECSSQIKESTIHHILTKKTPLETAERLNPMSKQQMTPNKIHILLAISKQIQLSFLHFLLPLGLLIERLFGNPENCLELRIRKVSLSFLVINSFYWIAGLGS